MLESSPVKFCLLPCGKKIAWREWGSGKPLVMLHGWSMSSVVFNEVAPLLAEKYRVLCPDLPGHGFSAVLPGCQLSDMAAVICEWIKAISLADVALFGWSLGGQVALQVAIENRVKVDKLLLVATTPCFCQKEDWQHGLPATQIRALDRNLGRCYEKTLGDFFNLQFMDEDLSKERYRQILTFAVRTGRLPEVSIAREILKILGQADLRTALPTLKTPTTILHGDLDQIIPLAAGEYLAESMPNASLSRFSGVGHAPFFSRPLEAVAHWLEFLQ